MPRFDNFDNQINNIYKKFFTKKIKEDLGNKKYKLYYHMHPNRRLKKMLFLYPVPIRSFGYEAKMPFFTVSVNKIKKNNKKEFICIYNNFYEGGIKEVKFNFSLLEDDKNIKHNIKQLNKVIKIIKYGFDQLYKNLGKVNFYKQ